MDLGVDVLADAQDSGQVSVSDTALSNIAQLAMKQLTLEERIERGEALLKQLKEELRRVQENELPDAMAEAGMAEFKLTNGGKVTIKPFVNCVMRKDFKREAVDWLDSNGHGGLVKREISVTIPKGKKAEELRAKVSKALTDVGVPFEEEANVHPQTLSAWAREMTEDNRAIPEQLFSVYTGRKAVVKV